MIVTRIVEVAKNRCEIFIDEIYAFVLYRGEMRKFHVEEGMELDEDIYQEIVSVILPRRAKLRAMNLLQSRDYTRKQLHDKLVQGGYQEQIIEDTLEYLVSYRYIDDLRYARNYISYRLQSKSRKKLEMDLLTKGVTKETIILAFEELYEEGEGIDEEAMIRSLLKKKQYDPDTASRKDTERLYAFLMRKGFASDVVKSVMFSKE